MFGEVALINRIGRNAHCIATMATEICVLSFEDYNTIFKTMMNEEQKYKRSFFERVVLKEPSLWDYSKQITSYFEKNKYPRGAYFLKAGKQSSMVRIIVSGQVRFFYSSMIKIRQDREIDHHLRNSSQKIFDICIVGPGEMVGDEWVFDEPNPLKCISQYNAVVDTECVVYECPKKNYYQAADTHPSIYDYFRSLWRAKKALLEKNKDIYENRLMAMKGEEKISWKTYADLRNLDPITKKGAITSLISGILHFRQSLKMS